MALSERLAIIISANGAQAAAEFKSVGTAATRSLATTEQRAQRFGTQLTRIGAGAVVFGGVLAAGMYQAAQAAQEQEVANLRLENTIAKMPPLAGASAQAFYDQAEALQQVTRFGDEATVSAQAMLGTFNLTQDQILQLIPVVQDYAAKFGVDLVDASKQVGRAVMGNIGALTRNGVTIDRAAFAADHFGATLEALRSQAGGFAESEGQTLNGQIEILKNRLGEIAESLGGGASDAFATFTGLAGTASDALDGMSQGSQDFLGKALTYGSVGAIAAGGLAVIAGQAIKTKARFVELANTVAATRARLALLSVGGGGFWGVAAAATAAGIGLAMYQRAQDKAARVSNFADALKQEAEGFEDATNSALAHVLATDGAINNYRDLGISADLIVGAIRGEAGAWEELQTAREEAEAVMADNDLHDPAIEDRAFQIKELVRSVGLQRDAYGEASDAQRDFEAALTASGGAADGLSQSIEELSAEIDEYLGGLFDVPGAQRALGESFASLADEMTATEPNWRDQAAAQEEVVRKYAELIDTMNQQSASQAELDAAMGFSIGILGQMRDRGEITQEQFSRLSQEIRGVPRSATTETKTPGLPAAISGAYNYREELNRIPRLVETTVRLNTGRLYADIAGAAAQLRSLRDPESGGGRGGVSVPGAAPSVIVVGSVDEAFAMAGVRPDQRSRTRRRMLTGAV